MLSIHEIYHRSCLFLDDGLPILYLYFLGPERCLFFQTDRLAAFFVIYNSFFDNSIVRWCDSDRYPSMTFLEREKDSTHYLTKYPPILSTENMSEL